MTAGRFGRAGTLLAVLAVAELMLTVDLSIVNVALPDIRSDLGFGASGLEWVVNGYALTFGGLLLLGGRAADVVGGRPVFLVALGVFTLASLVCGLAASPGMLVAARLVQGAGAGVLSPTTLSILTATFAPGEQRNRALAIWTGVAIGGGAVGAVLGGVVTSGLSWRWIFFVNVPIGLALLAAAARLLPAPAGHRGRLDVAGAALVTAGLAALVWSLGAAQPSARALAGLLVSTVLLALFAVREVRAQAPLVPFAAVRPLAAGNLLSFVSFFPVLAIWYFLTLYLQADRGYSPVRAGLLFVPLTVAVAAGSQVSFRVLARVDARLLLGAGAMLAAAGAGWLSRLSPGGDVLTTVILPAVVVMLGGGLMFAPITVSATSGAPAEQGGLASGLLTTSRQVGGALGLAVLGAVAAGGRPTGALLVAAAAFAVTGVLGALLLPRRFGPPEATDPAPRPKPAGARR